MKHNLSPRKIVAVATEAFLGPREARDQHRRSLGEPITIQSGLSVIRARWPELQSKNKTAPVFIFSAGWRSGSTFLQRWIMTGGNVLVWGEPYERTELIRSMAAQLKAFTPSWPDDEYFFDENDCLEDLSGKWVANLYPPLASLMDAHIACLENLFFEPARTLGKSRWGLKAVTLTVGHAQYLQWLFPNAKFLFLCRDPYDAYGSYRKWRNWYKTWPAEPVFTPARYGALWRDLAGDFLENHGQVGGLLLHYEKLHEPAIRRQLENYLEFSLPEASSVGRVGATSVTSRTQRQHWVPKLEVFLLNRQVAAVRRQLGYTSR